MKTMSLELVYKPFNQTCSSVNRYFERLFKNETITEPSLFTKIDYIDYKIAKYLFNRYNCYQDIW